MNNTYIWSPSLLGLNDGSVCRQAIANVLAPYATGNYVLSQPPRRMMHAGACSHMPLPTLSCT